MAGLVPAIHVDPRDKPGDDGKKWRTAGDTVERLEDLALRLVAGEAKPEPGWGKTIAVLSWIGAVLRPAVAACGTAEIAGIRVRRIVIGLFIANAALIGLALPAITRYAAPAQEPRHRLVPAQE